MIDKKIGSLTSRDFWIFVIALFTALVITSFIGSVGANLVSRENCADFSETLEE